MFQNMSDEKFKKTITGMVVAGTLVILTLIVVIGYQLIYMAVQAARINGVKEQISQYQEQKEKLQEELDYFSSDYGMDGLAYTYGYAAVEDAKK